MSLAVLASRALSGAHAHVVRVETHLGPGLPGFNVVGLPDAGVRESRERVRAAIINTASSFLPAASPSTCRRPTCPESGRFDLPIALGCCWHRGVAGTAIRRRRGWQAVRHAGVRVHAGAPGPGGRAVADRRADACHGAAADRAGRGGRSARRDARPARRQRSRRPGCPACGCCRLAAWRTRRTSRARMPCPTRCRRPGPSRRPCLACPTCAASRRRGARWRWRPPAVTAC